MNKSEKRIQRIVFLSYLCLFINSLIYSIPYTNKLYDSFFLLMYISLSCLVILYFRKGWKSDIPSAALKVYYLLLLVNIISIIRGIYTSTAYFDTKKLFVTSDGGLSLLIPLAMVVGVNYIYSRRIFRFCLLLFKCSFVIIPIALANFPEIYPRLMISIVLLICFFPYFNQRDKLLILVIGILSAVIAISWRANLLRVALSFSVLPLYYFRNMLLVRSAVKIALLILFVAPLYYLYLGIQGNSIFEKSSESGEYTVGNGDDDDNLLADTRTMLYTEVFNDLSATESLSFGKGATARYKTDIFDTAGNSEGRADVEVGFLGILMYCGILGFALQAIILWIAIYYGIKRTNNTLSKMLALFLAAHWLILFVENSMDYGQYYYFVWIAVGLCLSESFRSNTDEEIKQWINNDPILKHK